MKNHIYIYMRARMCVCLSIHRFRFTFRDVPCDRAWIQINRDSASAYQFPHMSQRAMTEIGRHNTPQWKSEATYVCVAKNHFINERMVAVELAAEYWKDKSKQHGLESVTRAWIFPPSLFFLSSNPFYWYFVTDRFNNELNILKLVNIYCALPITWSDYLRIKRC